MLFWEIELRSAILSFSACSYEEVLFFLSETTVFSVVIGLLKVLGSAEKIANLIRSVFELFNIVSFLKS